MSRVKKSLKVLLMIGVIILIAGVVLCLLAPTKSAENLDIVASAATAQDAAEAISSNNRLELMMHVIGMACLGFGCAVTVLSAIMFAVKRKNS